MSLKLLMMVVGAGALGTLARYLLGIALSRYRLLEMPVATLAVNILGCFAAGVLYALFAGKLERFSDYAPVLLIGFLGAFTTFSAFALENAIFLQNGQAGRMLLSVGLHNILGLAAVFGGYYLIKVAGWTA